MCTDDVLHHNLAQYQSIDMLMAARNIYPDELPILCNCTLSTSRPLFLWQRINIQEAEGFSRQCSGEHCGYLYIPCQYQDECESKVKRNDIEEAYSIRTKPDRTLFWEVGIDRPDQGNEDAVRTLRTSIILTHNGRLK